MIAALARHWRNLLRKNTPEQLGLDSDFSYPALISFLQAFKDCVERVNVFAGIAMKFCFDVGSNDELAIIVDDLSASGRSLAFASMSTTSTSESSSAESHGSCD